MRAIRLIFPCKVICLGDGFFAIGSFVKPHCSIRSLKISKMLYNTQLIWFTLSTAGFQVPGSCQKIDKKLAFNGKTKEVSFLSIFFDKIPEFEIGQVKLEIKLVRRAIYLLRSFIFWNNYLKSPISLWIHTSRFLNWLAASSVYIDSPLLKLLCLFETTILDYKIQKLL